MSRTLLASSRLLKNHLILTDGGNAGDRVISEARRIRSHSLLADEKAVSRTLDPLRRKAGPHLTLSMLRLCRLADEITRASAEAEFFSMLLVRARGVSL
jgi:hypothetical protein